MDLATVLFFFVFFGVIVLIIASHQSDKAKAKKQLQYNYQWYVDYYKVYCPDGVVHCHQCRSDRSLVHISKYVGLRDHVCAQCGTLLYYSLNSAPHHGAGTRLI